jgi:hypothetical protein
MFNLVMGKVITDAGIQTTSTAFYNSAQLLAFADGIDIIGRSQEDKKKFSIVSNTAADAVGLKVNQEHINRGSYRK